MSPRLVFAWSGAAEQWRTITAASAARAAEIVTLTLDLGQGVDLEELRDRALAAGAVRAHVLDVRDEFAREYVLPALHAHALLTDPMARQLAAELTSKKLEAVAAIEDGSPVLESVTVSATLLGRHDTTATLTQSPAEAPQTPAHVEVAFERGVPRAVNGVPMALTELIDILTIIGGHHGVGRVGDVEAPAAVVLITAYTHLANGGAPGSVTGTVRLRLLKGEHAVVEPS
jgi:argininosuccinate synthase